MRTYPYTMENGAGEQITFIGIVHDADGDRIVGEGRAQPGAGPPMHVHYLEEEGFTVKAGTIGYQILGQEPRYANQGETVAFAPGIGHRWWNAGTTEVRFAGWAKPPNNHEYILAAIFASMKRNGGKRPSVFDTAFLLRRYRTESGMFNIPIFVLKVIFPIVALVGKMLGKYEHFTDAPEPLDGSTVPTPQARVV